jgi:hypothetical protein
MRTNEVVYRIYQELDLVTIIKTLEARMARPYGWKITERHREHYRVFLAVEQR